MCLMQGMELSMLQFPSVYLRVLNVVAVSGTRLRMTRMQRAWGSFSDSSEKFQYRLFPLSESARHCNSFLLAMEIEVQDLENRSRSRKQLRDQSPMAGMQAPMTDTNLHRPARAQSHDGYLTRTTANSAA